MADKTESVWAEAPEAEEVEYVSEEGKKYLVQQRVKFTIVGVEHQKESQFGPRWVFTIENEKGEPRNLSMSDKDPNMGRNKVNRWIAGLFESGRVSRLDAILTKKGRAYSIADPDNIPF